jgi:hypothetical protein
MALVYIFKVDNQFFKIEQKNNTNLLLINNRVV